MWTYRLEMYTDGDGHCVCVFFLKKLEGTTYIWEMLHIMLMRDKWNGTELIIGVNVLLMLEEVFGCL